MPEKSEPGKSEPGKFDPDVFAKGLAGCLDLSPDRAAHCRDLVETHILARLATKADCASITARIAALREEINDGADVMFRHLVTSIERRPPPVQNTVHVPSQSVQLLERTITRRLERLQRQIWGAFFLVFLLVIAAQWRP